MLVVVHFYAGILALLHDGAPVRAADHFAAAASVAKYQFTRFGEYRDPETPALEVQALSWRVNALAGCVPEAVPAAIDDLEAAIDRTGADPTGVARLRTLPARRLAVTWPRRVRLKLGRRKRAAENRLTHWRRGAASASPPALVPAAYSRSIFEWSPSIRRRAFGSCAERLTSTSRPISESAIPPTPMIRLCASTTECSSSESRISHSAAIDVNGPI